MSGGIWQNFPFLPSSQTGPQRVSSLPQKLRSRRRMVCFHHSYPPMDFLDSLVGPAASRRYNYRTSYFYLVGVGYNDLSIRPFCSSCVVRLELGCAHINRSFMC